jgi:tryptophan synthase beta chain
MSYEKFHDGRMSDYIPTDDEINASLANLPKID